MMPDSVLEGRMDDYIRQNLIKLWYIKYFDAQTNQWKPIQTGNLTPKTKYKLFICANNNGTETYMKNVQIRVINPTPTRVTYFKDDTYTTAVPRLDSPIYPSILKPRATEGGSGDSTPMHVVPFMVKAGVDAFYSIAGIGLYAEIVPQGHAWSDLKYYLD